MNKNHEVLLYCMRYDKSKTFSELIENENGIIELGAWGAIFEKIKTILSYRQLINKEKPQIIIASNYPANILGCFPLKNKKIRKIWICNEISVGLIRKSGLLWSVYYEIEKYLNKKYDEVIVNSKATKKKYENYYGFEPYAIYSGLDTEYLKNLITKKPSQLKRNEFLLVFGRVEFHKNIEIISRICNYLKIENEDADIVVAGSGDGVSYVKEISKEFQNLIYIGTVTENQKKWLYENCIGYLFLPRDEPLGVTLMEAIYYGAEVVAYNKGGPSEIIINREVGRLANSDDEYLANILDLTRRNNNKNQEIISIRRNYITNNFSLDKMLSNMYLKIFNTK